MSDRINLSPYNLLIATPAMDGKVEINYQHSLEYTKRTIEEYGGKCSVCFYQYIADVAYARAKMFSEFVRKKEYSHMLFVDADMGWNPADVAYFLLLNRDFLAAVGPKKKFPIEFAWNMNGDEGKPVPLIHELETNVAQAPFVGGAFLMISRHCADKLTDAYPELQFYSPDGTIEWAIFDPIIIGDKRRLSEDFTLCWRWRNIGGKVEVKMDVELTHTGAHTFRGNLYSHLMQTNQNSSHGYAVFNNEIN